MTQGSWAPSSPTNLAKRGGKHLLFPPPSSPSSPSSIALYTSSSSSSSSIALYTSTSSPSSSHPHHHLITPVTGHRPLLLHLSSASGYFSFSTVPVDGVLVDDIDDQSRYTIPLTE
jgi:hypothetical protein